MPISAGVQGGCSEQRRGQTADAKKEETTNPAHAFFLNAGSTCSLESICSPSPPPRLDAGYLFHAPRHVRLVGETQAKGDLRQRFVCGVNEPPRLPCSDACPEGLRRDTKHLRKSPGHGPWGQSVFLSPLRQEEGAILKNVQGQLVRPVSMTG